jgi:hypothetical protein
MTALDAYGVGGLALVVLVFVSVRHVSVYAMLGVAVIGGFVLATSRSASAHTASTRLVIAIGLSAWVFGLLIVRVMLVRSVSLRLLARIDSSSRDAFDAGIRARIGDMQRFHLVRETTGGNMLTGFGGLVGGLVAACYIVLGIEA